MALCWKCGHPFSDSELRAGWRNCEYCLDPPDPDGRDDDYPDDDEYPHDDEIEYPAWTERSGLCWEYASWLDSQYSGEQMVIVGFNDGNYATPF